MNFSAVFLSSLNIFSFFCPLKPGSGDLSSLVCLLVAEDHLAVRWISSANVSFMVCQKNNRHAMLLFHVWNLPEPYNILMWNFSQDGSRAVTRLHWAIRFHSAYGHFVVTRFRCYSTSNSNWQCHFLPYSHTVYWFREQVLEFVFQCTLPRLKHIENIILF